MGKIVLDDATVAKLSGLTEPVELVDAAGKRVAVCTPTPPEPPPPTPGRFSADFTPGAYAPFTDDEVREGFESLARGERGITTAELLAKMRDLR